MPPLYLYYTVQYSVQNHFSEIQLACGVKNMLVPLTDVDEFLKENKGDLEQRREKLNSNNVLVKKVLTIKINMNLSSDFYSRGTKK